MPRSMSSTSTAGPVRRACRSRRRSSIGASTTSRSTCTGPPTAATSAS
jgi:hypothetical protein